MTFGSRCTKYLRALGCAATLLFASAGALQGQETAPDAFHAGDRIFISVEGPVTFADTAVVREGLVIRIPNMGDISLAGVRRADAEKYLSQEIAKYVKNPVVHATPLVRIAVLGEVGRPGFYTVPSDVLLSDVVMRAGGPTGNADLNKTVVKRGGHEVISAAMARNALSSGQTLDDMRVAPGDEVVVGQQSHLGFGTVLQTVSVVASLLGILYYARHR